MHENGEGERDQKNIIENFRKMTRETEFGKGGGEDPTSNNDINDVLDNDSAL